MASEPPVLRTPAARRRSWFIKIVSIGALLLLLHVPLLMTHGVLRERRGYQAQATEEISRIWGREQKITGPVLAVPYTYRDTVIRTRVVNGSTMQVDEPAEVEATAYFLPDRFDVQADVAPDIRHRGIYDVVVYTARLKIACAIRPDFVTAGIQAVRIEWPKSRVLFGVSDLHGIRSIGRLRRADGSDAAFDAAESGATRYLQLVANPGLTQAPDAALEFTFDALVQGSGALTLVPVGKDTAAKMHSTWTAPSFSGAWLPVTRQVAPGGFDAEWTVAHFSRGFPQSWTNRSVADADIAKMMDATAFGVRLGQAVTGYSMVERAQKYGVLFFVLVFAVFFLFEVTSALRIHPLQYAMVGAALCLFFLGFLALTEFWSTALAYAVTAGACTAMVSLYAWTFLRSGARTLVVLGGLATTYGYLYFVLQSEDYALLAGTLALFAVLAVIMFFTRRINWYALDAPVAGRAA
jgi:inner membrane protein